MAFGQTLEDLYPVITDDANFNIGAALAFAVFDDNKFAPFKIADGLWRQPQYVVFLFEHHDDPHQIAQV